jgi:hypothetical protein
VRAAVALLVLVAGCTTTVRQHPEFAARRAQITGVAVMPPDVTVMRKVFKGDDEPLLADAATARARLPLAIAAELRKRGFTVKPALLDEPDVAGDDELRYQTTLVTGRFRAAGMQLQPFAGMGKAQAAGWRLSIGPEVNRFADHAGVDALVFAQMAGWTKSGGEIARDVAVTVLTLGNLIYYRQAAVVQVALVDGTTGEILWANVGRTVNRDFTGDGLDGMVRAAFDGFPH